ncbi:MAG: Peptide chain release factor 2 [Parcubacteria group bacterium GW2011_GWA2_45_30]|nr:MAG: Peptide chain release factor 2 [Parcubacteria group bacterium GW2011_GWA2_45_30]
MQHPNFWDDRERAARQAQDLASLKRTVEEWGKLNKEVIDLSELSSSASSDANFTKELGDKVGVVSREIHRLENELYFSGKYDKGNAVLSVYAGAGGKDAEDWAALLLRMFSRLAERRKWVVKILHEHWGEYSGPGGWGMKNVTIAIQGPGAYGYLKKESGVHRLVRISPFSAQKLRHTSFALVDVMPEFVAPDEVELKPDDIKVEFFRSSGPGGQNVNKRETAVRIVHTPTGIQVASQSERSQERNREIAMDLLRSKLYRATLEKQEQERRGVRNEKVSIEWGNQIRSYVMHPYQMVKDHRTNAETSQIDKVLDGDLDEFIEAEVKI